MEIGAYKQQFSASSLEEKKAAIVRLESSAATILEENGKEAEKAINHL